MNASKLFSALLLIILWEAGSRAACVESVTNDHWKGEFYLGTTLSNGPFMVRDEGTGTLDFDWGTTGPSNSCGIGGSLFSVRWTRTIDFGSSTCSKYRFTMTIDDGGRLYVDGNLVIDKWFPQGTTTYTADVPLSPGAHLVVMEYFQNTGGAVAKLSWAATCNDEVPADSWRGEYFNNTGLSGCPAMVRNDGNSFLDMNWGTGGPNTCGVGVDNFSVRWTRSVAFNPSACGAYQFTVTVDDGFRLYIDDNLVMDHWIFQGATTYTTSIPLTAGNHVLRFEYFEGTGDALAKLSWELVGSGCVEEVSTQHWMGEYFNNANLGGCPAVVRDDGARWIDFDWSTNGVETVNACGLGAQNFSVRWTRSITFSPCTYRFNLAGDDNAKLYVDGVLQLDTASGGQIDLPMNAGAHLVRVEYSQLTGNASVKFTYAPAPAVPCVVSVAGDHWQGEYFNNLSLAGCPSTVKDDGAGNLDFNWGATGPTGACGIGAQDFSVRWTTTRYFPAWVWRFSVTSDDGFRLYVDEELVLDRWFDQGTYAYTADVPLMRGFHTVRLEYYQRTGGAEVHLSWADQGRVVGNDYGEFREGQAPTGAQPSDAQVWEDIGMLQKMGNAIRVFGPSADGSSYRNVDFARRKKLLTVITAYTVCTNWDYDNVLIQQAVDMARKEPNVMFISVGSECILRWTLGYGLGCSPGDVMAHVDYARSLNPPVPLTYADMKGFLTPYPWMTSHLDFIFLNSYGYWETWQNPAGSVNYVADSVTELANSTGKRVIVSEAGWPTVGDTHGAAVPGVGPAMDFAYTYLAMMRSRQIDGFYFEAFDEPWKTGEGNGGVGASWGYYYVNRQPKGPLKTLLAASDLGVTVTASTNKVAMGDSVTYTVALYNYGPDWATQVTLSDAIPQDMAVQSVSTSWGTIYAGPEGTVVLHTDMAPNSGITVTIVAKPLKAGTYGHTARVGQFESDPNPSNNAASITTPTDDFRITTVQHAAPGQMAINFNTSLNKTYRVLYCDDLAQNVWQDVDGLDHAGTGGNMQVIDSTAGNAARRFYKVRVQ